MSKTARALQRVSLPVVLFALTNIAAGCFQQAAPDASTTRVLVAFNQDPAVQAGSVAVPLSDDASLSMPALEGTPTAVNTVKILPNGNVTDTEAQVTRDEGARPVVTEPVTRWVKSTGPTRLWSSAGADASPFTELPLGSFLRVEGPPNGGRLPVYYVGDGLLRRAGEAWVDATTVESVDAPPPGQVSAVDADAKQPLPVWVQAHQGTRLWSGPDDKAVSLTDLPQWTFLKVAGLERDGRLLVNFAGDYATRQPGIGWVDVSSVGPAGDPGRWVTNHRATALWSGVDEQAMRFNDLPQWTKLRLVDGAPANAGRIEVQFFGDGLRLPGTAWVARADIGPITPPVPMPAVAVAAAPSTTAVRTPESHSFGTGDEFISAVGAAARSSFRATGVPASVTVAQAILESDWGRSRLTRQGNNLFGIKALNGAGPAGVVTLATWEHVNGSDVVVQAPFKAYYTLEESIDDHGRFFTRNKRYADALAVANDARAFARAIQEDGYATDPGYASKLIKLMDRYDLYRFDG
ncbi:MAG TPA: glucosaminidase domain-containing protein [Chloroflexota bacterium]